MPEMMGNPDAGQDRQLIQQILAEELGPVFEVIESRLKDLEEDLGETKDLLMKFTEALVSSADGYKRSSLSEELMGKYGKDIEPYDGLMKDTVGKSFSESLLDELMGEGAPDEAHRDEWMKGKLENAKGKYGKYIGISVGEKPEAEAKEAEAADKLAEAEAEEAPEAAAEGEEEESPMSASESAAEGLMNQLKGLGGKQHSLSKPSGKK